MKKTLGALLLCHQRHQLLPLIARQIEETWPRDSVLHVGLDRPTDEVRVAVDKCFALHSDVRVSYVPVPALAEKENFLELRNWQLDAIREDCHWGALQDDDYILQFPTNMRNRMEGPCDLVYANKMYIWNDLGHCATHLPLHHSCYAFRILDADRFPTDRMIQAPARVHDHGRKETVNGWLLDIGYLTRNDRMRIFKTYARAGKIDRLTMGLIEEGTTEPILFDDRWYREVVRELI
jgi:hypothetical protein